MPKITERESRLVAAVDRERLMEHTRTIAQWERLSGSAPELEAFKYVQSVLDGYGYQTELVRCDALISLPRRARLTIEGLGEVVCITHSMGTSVQGLTGEVVYCGLGRPDDYRRVDVRGKIALVEGIAMPVKVKAGEDAGAIAQIHISGDHLHEMCISTVWGSPTPETAGLLPRTPSVTIHTAGGDKIKNLLAQGPLRAEITTEVDTCYVPIPVLTADWPGSSEAEHFVLFSGHIDSWYYGAMDNGSANATQLEVARVLAQHGPHRRGLRLAFWSGHSHGRYAGSTWYVDNHWEELHDRCIAHINIDSVGGKGATVLTHSYAMQELRPLAQEVIAAMSGQEFHGARVGRAGDHSFMGTGLPAMFMDLSQQPVPEVETPTSRAFAQLAGGSKTGGLGWWWHTPDDTLDKLDPDLLLRDAQIYVVIVNRLLNSLVLPMDFRLTVQEIRELISGYQAKAAGHFDLGPALSRAEELQAAVDALYRQAAALADGGNQAALAALNQGLRQLSRALTPLNYTQSGQFEHDPALGLPPLPLLRLAAELSNLAPGSDAYRRALTALVRRRNAVCHALRQARETVSATAAALAAAGVGSR